MRTKATVVIKWKRMWLIRAVSHELEGYPHLPKSCMEYESKATLPCVLRVSVGLCDPSLAFRLLFLNLLLLAMG